MMKKFGFIILGLGLVVCLSSCAKKQEALEEMQAPISMEALSVINTQDKVAPPEIKTQSAQAVPSAVANLEPLPPVGPYKPTATEIQTALKNAGYYTGAVDGKIGPLTKKAIEEFQKANGLKADAKVGIKTWDALSKYLNPEPITKTKTPAKKR